MSPAQSGGARLSIASARSSRGRGVGWGQPSPGPARASTVPDPRRGTRSNPSVFTRA